MRNYRSTLLGAVLLLSVSNPAWSQEVAADGPPVSERVYPAAFFASYAPQTALDMVRRVPGFTLQEGESLRGFAGGGGNVLVDGARPASKSGTLEDILSQIPALQVDRIEIVRGATVSGEALGQIIVANVVRRRSTDTRGWEVAVERAPDGVVSPSAEMSVSRSGLLWDDSLKFRASLRRLGLTGTRAVRDANGNLISTRTDDRPDVLSDVYLAGAAARPLAAGRLSLNGRVGWSRASNELDSYGFRGRLPDETPDDLLEIDFQREVLAAEVSADWTRALDRDWTVKALTLVSLEDERSEEDTSLDDRTTRDSDSATFQRTHRLPFEAIGRLTFSKGGEGPLRPDGGVELAYNRLDSTLNLIASDSTGVRPILIPAADVVVEELRGEVFSTWAWRPSPDLTLDGGVAVEGSSISVTGDAERSRQFIFFKPHASASYQINENVRVQIAARRSVGQLTFTDFAASATAADGRETAGNPDLEPQKATRVSAASEIRFGARGAISLDLFHEWREDVLERIPLPSGGEGLGNAGDARYWGASVSGTVPLEMILAGAMLSFKASVVDSEFVDPIDGRPRDIHGLVSPTIDAEFRQDIPSRERAWGVGYTATTSSEYYYPKEVDLYETGDTWRAFLEQGVHGVRFRFEASNLGLGEYGRLRAFYTPTRAGVLSGTEERSRHRGTIVRVTARRQF